MKQHLPNALTLSRLVLAVVFVALLSRVHWGDERFVSGGLQPSITLLIAAAIFIIAALTDALDGYLARRWNVISVFGRVMDPFADKLLVLGAFVLLAGPGFSFGGTQVSGVQPWMAVVILGRELLVTSLRGVVESRGVDFSATTSGKLKMVLQSICVPAVLIILALGDAMPPSLAHTTILALVWFTVAISAWSGVPYVIRAWRAMRA